MTIYAPLPLTSGSLVSQPDTDQLKTGWHHDANGCYNPVDGSLDATPNVPSGGHRVVGDWWYCGEHHCSLSGHRLRPGVI